MTIDLGKIWCLGLGIIASHHYFGWWGVISFLCMFEMRFNKNK